ncbi:MAG: hypothetical protein V4507_05025 [Verrucomicrobiota bacterium]
MKYKIAFEIWAVFIIGTSFGLSDISYSGQGRRPPGSGPISGISEFDQSFASDVSTQVMTFSGSTTFSSLSEGFFKTDGMGAWSYPSSIVFSGDCTSYSYVTFIVSGSDLKEYFKQNSNAGLGFSMGGYNNIISVSGSYSAAIYGDRNADISASFEFYRDGQMKMPVTFSDAINDGTNQGPKVSYVYSGWTDSSIFYLFVDHAVGYYNVSSYVAVPPFASIPNGQLNVSRSKTRSQSLSISFAIQ